MARVALGKTFADLDHPGRWYVLLPVDGAFCLVWWEGGRPRTVLRSQVRIEQRDFAVYQLLARWGIKTSELDAFLERRFYRWEPDVRKVRQTRKPLTTPGRTLEHQPHQHRAHL